METKPSKIQEAEKIEETDRKMDPDDHALDTLKTEESEETDPSKVQEVEKIKENDEKMDPDHDHAPEPMKSEEKPNVTRVSALDMILKSLSQFSVFTKELAHHFQETQDMVTENETVLQPLHGFLVSNLSLTDPMEENSACDMFVTIMELLRSQFPPLSHHFEVSEAANKICNRCKMNTEYPVERSYGLLMNASSIREIKNALKDFTFENILKVIRMNLKMPCDKEGCEKQNYVQRTISKLPNVFPIALEWENNETDAEILVTTSFLATEIDISAIYLYEVPCAYTKYRLVSMVCLHGDEYNCVAYENNRWVRYFSSEKEVIGDWDGVVDTFVTRKIRPEILFFEYGQQRDQIVSGTRPKE